MEKLLSDLPLDYLKFLYKSNNSIDSFQVNGKNVYEDENSELYSDEEFKTHGGINIGVSNYGRLKAKNGIIKQEMVKSGYPFIVFPYKITDLQNEILDKKIYKFRTPIANTYITEDKNIPEIKYEKYDEHPYLQICINKRGFVFTIEYGTNRKIFFSTSETKNGDKIVSIPIYIYRLVAETWIDNPNPKVYNQVHHIVNNGCNNTKYNLMWVDNDQHRIIEKR